jgi:hypothetical protein
MAKGFDGELPPKAAQDVIDSVQPPKRVAYVFLGPDDAADFGYVNALILRAGLPTLRVFLAEPSAAAAWTGSRRPRGVLIGSKGKRIELVDKRTAENIVKLAFLVKDVLDDE